MPYLRMEMQVGSFAPAKAYPQPGGSPRGTFPPFHPRGSVVCAGVPAGCDSRPGLPPPRSEAVAALAAAVIAAAAVLAFYR